MVIRIAALSSLALLCACAEIISEERETLVLQSGFEKGTSYQLITQTVSNGTDTYQRNFVQYRGLRSICLADSPPSCEAEARRLIDQRFIVN